jgi:hypothetical protein
MALFRLLAAIALTAALAVPATAGAAERAAQPLAAAADVALRYWGATPCSGRVTVTAKRTVVAGLVADSDAWVTFASPLGANNLAAPAASYTDCAIAFARWRWPTASSMRQDWSILCATMVHEWGHLLGRQHDSTPGNVMVPVFTDYSSVPASCRASAPRLRGARHPRS